MTNGKKEIAQKDLDSALREIEGQRNLALLNTLFRTQELEWDDKKLGTKVQRERYTKAYKKRHKELGGDFPDPGEPV